MNFRWSRAAGLASGLALCLATAPPSHAQDIATVDITYLSLQVKRSFPLSYLDQPPADEGIQGARLALADNQTTGKFLNQDYTLDEAAAPSDDQVVAKFKEQVGAGHLLFVTDLPAPLLLKVADLPEAKDAVLLDAATSDDSLRGADCRKNVLHLLPSRNMLADALMQYLKIKQWEHLLLVTGQEPADQAYGAALRRSAKKFQLKLVADKPWTFVAGARRSDTGHFQIEAEVARFTQGLSYDVLVVADEADNFGDDLAYRTTDPRPIAGTQGLVATAWARPFEQWGGTQLQNRFLRQANRWMTNRDFGAWMAVRAVGEAATRGGSTDQKAIVAYLHGDKFALAAFKGTELTFRPWDGQLRQTRAARRPYFARIRFPAAGLPA